MVPLNLARRRLAKDQKASIVDVEFAIGEPSPVGVVLLPDRNKNGAVLLDEALANQIARAFKEG